MLKRGGLTREVLHDLYMVRGLTPTQIAQETGYSFQTVQRNLRALDFPRIRKPSVVRTSMPPVEWLREQFEVERRSLADIGKEVGCGAHPIRTRLMAAGVPMRSKGGQTPITDRDWLMEQYWYSNRTLTDIAAGVGCHLNYLRREMARLNVPRKPRSLTRDNAVAKVRTRRAARAGNFSDTQRLKILRRDGNSCCMCSSTYELEIHHIIPVWAGGNATLENGITLCGPCHWQMAKHELDYVEKLLAARRG